LSQQELSKLEDQNKHAQIDDI
jgi:hypothetical protein